MAKGVLGNDPFQRGAASREGERTKPGTPPRDRPPSEREGTATQKAHSKNGADAKKQPARGKPASGKAKSRGPEARGSEQNGRVQPKDAKKSAPSSARDADNRNSTAARSAARNNKGAKGESNGEQRPANTRPASTSRNNKAARGAPARGKPPSTSTQGSPSRGSAGERDGLKRPLTTTARGTPSETNKGASDTSERALHAGATPGESRPRGEATTAAGDSRGTSTPPLDPSHAASAQAPVAASHSSRGTGTSASSPLAATENEVEPLREPAAPVTPRAAPPSRPPAVLEERAAERTPQQRNVDHALAEALAAEVAEVTAKHAVDEAMDRRAGREEATDRLLATEMATGLAEAAVEEVLDHSPVTRKPEHERELAATVAAQVAESAAELAVAEVMVHRSAEPPFTDSFEERATVGFLDELAEDEEVSTLELREDLAMAGAVLELEDLDETPEEVEDGWERTISRPVVDSTFQAPEVEMPDTTRDEFPPGRRGPLSLVPPSRDDAFHGASSEPAHDAGSPRPLAQRASGMFALAREIAGQALASEGLGRAWGAMNGMLDAVRAGLGTGGGAHLDEYGKDPSLVERLEPVLEFLYGQYWRVSAQGTDHIPGGAVILVANHSGALPYDGLVMSLTLGRERPDLRESRWLVEDQVFHAPMLGTLFNRLGAVRACPENALRLLDEQRPLVVFPEGYQGLSKPFGERYRLKRFGRGGFVKLALRTGAPIVPVAIVGAEETSPMLGRIPASFLGLPYLPLMPGPLPLPAKWSIRFGEPIAMDGLPPEAADDLGEVGRLTERTREAIQGMLHSLLRERRSVFAG